MTLCFSVLILTGLLFISLPKHALAALDLNQVQAELSTVWEFNNGTWAENLSVRPNGEILVDCLSQPQTYLVDPTNQYPAVPIHTFADGRATSVSGIVQNPPGSDVYYVATGNFSFFPYAFVPGTWAVHRINMTTYVRGGAKAKVDKIADVPGTFLIDGLAVLDDENVLAAGSVEGIIWGVNTKTRVVTAVLEDPLLAPPPNVSLPLGVNGIKIRGDELYWTNTAKALVAKVRIHPNGSAKGTPVVLASNITGLDDFILNSKGVIAAGAELIFIDHETGTASVISNSTLLETSRALQPAGIRESGEDVYYVSTNGGPAQYFANKIANPGKILRLLLRGDN